MEIELAVKYNAEVTVCCNDVYEYSVETVRTNVRVMNWTKVEVFAFGDIKLQMPLLRPLLKYDHYYWCFSGLRDGCPIF